MNDEAREEIELLTRFVNQLAGKGIDTDALIAGRNVAEARISQLKKKRGRKTREQFPMDHPAFAVAMSYADGHLSYEDAVGKIAEIIHKGPRTAEKHLSEMLPRAKRGLGFRDFLRANAVPKEKGS